MVKVKENKASNKQLVDEKIIKENSVTEPEVQKIKKKTSFFSRLMFLVFLVLFFAVFVAFQNPIIREHFFTGGAKTNEKDLNLSVQVLENNVLNMEEDFENLKRSLESDVDGLRDKYDSLEKHNLNVISSKADNASILGVIQRLDTIEVRLNEVAKVSDNGALIATAALLVKDAAERGSSFIYEMSVLKTLADGEPKIESYVSVLSQFDETGIYSETYLTNEFNKIYSHEELKKQEENTVKDTDSFMTKFNKKFGKIMTIKYRNAQEIEEINLDNVYVLVQSQDFSRAVFELDKPRYQEILAGNENLNVWMQNVKSRQAFLDAISKITAYSLGVMKANQLKN